MAQADQQKIKEILSRGVEEVIERESLERKLKSGKVLRVKFGIDPTSPDLHLGHAIPLRKLKQFQDLGHKVILLIGDFTATIGDPSGKSSTRPALTEQQVKKNMKDYLKQAGKILNIKKTEIRYNTEWFKNMKMKEFYSFTRIESVFELMTRSMFKERQDKGELLTLSEFTYPFLQAYDSYALGADVEIGGLDQIFNMLHGRKIQEKLGQKPQQIIALKLLIGLDGVNKMSKSLNNQIVIVDPPAEMYGKIMSIKDQLINEYLELCTELPEEKIKDITKMPNPRDQKALLAKEVVKMYHDEKEADSAAENFDKIFRRHETPDQIEIFETDKTSYPILNLLFDSKLAESKNDAKRVVEGGGVIVNNSKIDDWRQEINLENGMIIQFGKRKFIKIKLK